MDRERMSRFVRTHTPFQPPRFTWWHFSGLLILVGLLVFTQRASGVMADLSGLVLGSAASSWQLAIYVRIIIVLALYVLFGIRGQHWMVTVGMLFGVLGFEMRLGENRITHDPLTLGFFLVQICVFWFLARLMTRQPDQPRVKYHKERAV